MAVEILAMVAAAAAATAVTTAVRVKECVEGVSVVLKVSATRVREEQAACSGPS